MTRPATRSEIWADGIVHALALIVAVIGIGLLASHVSARRSGLELSATIIYGAALIAMLAFSCAYNLAREGKLKPFLRRLDHSGIYLLIAGTYTPLLTQFEDRFVAWALGLTVWSVALIGIVLKFAAPRRFSEDSSIIYLALSWVAIFAYEQIMVSLPPTALVLLVLGGAIYTVGVAFHLWQRLKFQRAIWHGFVAVAATCHWGAVAACMDLV